MVDVRRGISLARCLAYNHSQVAQVNSGEGNNRTESLLRLPVAKEGAVLKPGTGVTNIRLYLRHALASDSTPCRRRRQVRHTRG